MQELLGCRELDVAIGSIQLIAGLDLEVHPGELVCVIGCNGAGKTTLLHTLAGLRSATGITLLGQPLDSLSRRSVASKIALLTQQQEDAFPATAQQAVLLGRNPHLGFFEWESRDDIAIAADALQRVDMTGFGDRELHTLSGGERQRIALAATLAQQPLLYLLDEPLNNLDPQHQLGALRCFSQLCAQGKAVLASLHDLNLVAQFADRVVLLFGPQRNGAWMSGTVEECMTAQNLSDLYGTPIERVANANRSLFVHA